MEAGDDRVVQDSYIAWTLPSSRRVKEVIEQPHGVEARCLCGKREMNERCPRKGRRPLPSAAAGLIRSPLRRLLQNLFPPGSSTYMSERSCVRE